MNIIAAVALVGILIFIHEFGHFLFAKVFGVDVLVFSLGFGRRVFGFRHGGTDYRVSLLPIGGYVMMAGADPFMDGGDLDDIDSPGSFLKKPVWQRLIIVSAGPAFNLMLPVVVFTGLYMAGEPQPAAVVGTVLHGSEAEAAGLLPGDRIVELEGAAVTFWADMYEPMAAAADEAALDLLVQRGEAAPFAATVQVPELPEGDELSPYDLGLEYGHPDLRIGVDDPDSPAGRAGLQTFDRITSVDGQPLESYRDLMDALDAGDSFEIAYTREGEPAETTMARDPAWSALDLGFADPRANDWGVYPGYLFIGEILEDSAAERGNILKGDRLAGIDDQGLVAWSEVTLRIGEKQVGEGRESSAIPVTLTLVRDGRVVQETLEPLVVKDTDVLGRYRYRAMIGIGAGGGTVGGPDARRYYPFPEALPRAAEETVAMSGFVIEQVGKLVTGEAAPSKTLGGPIQIFRDAGAAARDGIYTWARMMGLLSISLGIINFLPVPVLDGGQFLFYAVEGVRGRPLSLAVRERAQQIGVLFLLALMFSVLIFDVNRWLSG